MDITKINSSQLIFLSLLTLLIHHLSHEKNTIEGLTERETIIKVISLVGFDGGELKNISDACILVPKNSTPQVEGFHLVITHMICSILRNRFGND